jgi:porphobilinogen synthase
MPGIYRLSIDLLPKEIEQIALLGIPAVLLFGIPENKDPQGSEAYHPQGIIQRAIRAVKDRVPEVLLITDVCLCEYTDHGHCGVIVKGRWITTAPLTFWLSPRWKPGLI